MWRLTFLKVLESVETKHGHRNYFHDQNVPDKTNKKSSIVNLQMMQIEQQAPR